MKYEVDADGVSHYILRELSYSDFDKSGRISIWKLSYLMQGVRRSYLQNIISRISGLTTFLRSQFFTMYPAFYASKRTQNNTMDFINTLSHVGRTSYCLEMAVHDLSTKTLLATSSVHAVCISRQTRRPLPIADTLWREEKLTTLCNQQRPITGPEFPARPPSTMCFTQTAIVMPSDTDTNEHLNQAMFIRFCFDCGSLAALNGHLPSFKRDLIYEDAKTVWLLYINEATMGQELSLCCWEDRNLKRTLWVEMCIGSEVIGQCQIQFYESGLRRSESKPSEGLIIAKL